MAIAAAITACTVQSTVYSPPPPPPPAPVTYAPTPPPGPVVYAAVPEASITVVYTPIVVTVQTATAAFAGL